MTFPGGEKNGDSIYFSAGTMRPARAVAKIYTVPIFRGGARYPLTHLTAGSLKSITASNSRTLR